MWARAILPYDLTGAHISHVEVDQHHGSTLAHLADRHTFLLAYTDGAGPPCARSP